MDNADLDPVLLAHELEKAWELMQHHMDAADKAKVELKRQIMARLRLAVKARAFDKIYTMVQFDPAAEEIRKVALAALKEHNSLCARQDNRQLKETCIKPTKATSESL